MTLHRIATCTVATTALSLFAGTARANTPLGRYTVSTALVFDNKTNLTWQRTYSAVIATGWVQAKSYCTSQGGGWRLPTIKELQTLIDHTKGTAPFFDDVAFPTDGDDSPIFWSSTELGGYAYAVGFAFGNTYAYSKDIMNIRAHCVR